jgi:hypothetical protein
MFNWRFVSGLSHGKAPPPVDRLYQLVPYSITEEPPRRRSPSPPPFSDSADKLPPSLPDIVGNDPSSSSQSSRRSDDRRSTGKDMRLDSMKEMRGRTRFEPVHENPKLRISVCKRYACIFFRAFREMMLWNRTADEVTEARRKAKSGDRIDGEALLAAIGCQYVCKCGWKLCLSHVITTWFRDCLCQRTQRLPVPIETLVIAGEYRELYYHTQLRLEAWTNYQLWQLAKIAAIYVDDVHPRHCSCSTSPPERGVTTSR